MKLIAIHDIEIRRYAPPTIVRGRHVKGELTVMQVKAHLQPIDIYKDGGVRAQLLEQGKEVSHAKLLYIRQVKIEVNDIIIDMETGDEYSVLRLFQYNRYEMNTSHQRCLIYRRNLP